MNEQFSRDLGANKPTVTQPAVPDECRALPPRKRKPNVITFYRSMRTAVERGISRVNLSREKSTGWIAITRLLSQMNNEFDANKNTMTAANDGSSSRPRNLQPRSKIIALSSSETVGKGMDIPIQTTNSRAEKKMLWYIIHQQDSKLTEAERELFGTYVRLVRKTRGWTQSELAIRAQLDEVTIAALENGLAGEDQIGTAAIDRLTQSLGISFDRFIQRNPQVLITLWGDDSKRLDGGPVCTVSKQAVKQEHAYPD